MTTYVQDHLQDRETLRLCTAGSVDDGKSTFVGRLLHDTKSVLADQLSAVERTSREKGLGQLDLSLLVDGLRAEREQGITIYICHSIAACVNNGIFYKLTANSGVLSKKQIISIVSSL